MSFAPAALVACRDGAEPKTRIPAPIDVPLETPVASASNAAPVPDASALPAPLPVVEAPEATATGASCEKDQFRTTECVLITQVGAAEGQACPKTTVSSKLRSQFGGKHQARLDEVETAKQKSTVICCYEWCEAIQVTRQAPKTCAAPRTQREICIPMPERGTSAPSPTPFERCPAGIVVNDVGSARGSFPGHFDASGSETDGGAGECCYSVCAPPGPRPVRGRPARNDDGLALADPISNVAWLEPALDASANRELGLDDARLEHASVAAFARLSLSLLAFGAPPDLVAGAHLAALDEIRHATICFTRSGASVGPGPCPAFAELRAHRTLGDLAEESYLDGCIGETIAALDLHALAARHGDDVAGAMARDEERHAELAWRIVEWAIAVGGEPIRERIARVAASGAPTKDEPLASWAHANVIGPCTKVLLSEAA